MVTDIPLTKLSLRRLKNDPRYLAMSPMERWEILGPRVDRCIKWTQWMLTLAAVLMVLSLICKACGLWLA